MILWLRLFLEFFKTGLFAVGGGLATLPFLYDLSESTGWFTAQDIADLIAISESTPGALGVNMATYVGFHTAGVLGGIIATLGLVAPSIIIIILISKILNKFKESALVQKIFYGLRPASTALIAAAGLGVAKMTLLKLEVFDKTGSFLDLFNWKCIALAVVIYICLKKFKKHPIVYIAVSAVAGILLQL
jgi:chromate transporter